MTATAPALNPRDNTVLFKAKLELKINSKTEAFAQQLKLSVEDSVVTLEGVVPSEIDRKNAEAVVRTVMDVLGVDNKLEVAK